MSRLPSSIFARAFFFLAVLSSTTCLIANDLPPKVANAKVDFKTDIRPILSNRCFACHGPDEKHVESGLRLDQAESATSAADSGLVAIVPGNIEKSELVRRILETDESQRMPPPHFGSRLTEKETALIQSWINNGAPYSKHWSFEAIRSAAPPTCDLSTSYPKWQSSPVDSFILKKLSDKGWTPSPRASKQALLRRVTLDLTGIPPTMEEQTAFESDASDEAYAQVVDRLLASPAFGEHWGRKWLDLARYADSAGYADDPQRTIWAYRDWVVRAFNSGMPFDQFTIEQLAGDLLPNPTDDQLIATAFHRNTLTNSEGGTNDEEFRNVAVVDRVNTTMAVWMGLTMGCAQCHSHKFDPITQKEYFQVFSILNQTEDADRSDESPVLQWYTPEQRRDLETSRRELATAESALNAPDDRLRPEQTAWAAHLKTELAAKTIRPESATSNSGSVFTIEDSGRVRVQSNLDNDSFSLELPIVDSVMLEKLSGIQIQTSPSPDLAGGGVGTGDGNFVLTHVNATVVPKDSATVLGRFVRIEMQGDNKILSLAEVQVFEDRENIAVKGKATQSSTDFGGPAERAIDGNTSGIYADNSTTHSAISSSPWWEVDLGKLSSIEKVAIWNRTDGNTQSRLAGAKVIVLDEERRPLWDATIDNPKTSHDFEIRAAAQIPFSNANADYSQDGFAANNAIDQDPKSGWAVGGSINVPHVLNIGVNSNEWVQRIQTLKLAEKPSTLRLTLKFDSPHKKALLASFSVRVSDDDRFGAIARLPNSVLQLLRSEASLTDTERETLHSYYVTNITPGRQSIRDSIAALKKHISEIKPATTVPVMREMPAERQRTTKIQLRGNYKVLGDTVGPGVPSSLHPWRPVSAPTGESAKMNRLDLANWLMQSDNPLTARVLANRYWENLFGVGIVRTSEEFGSQGDLPSNPELLDHLASELIRTGWDTKRLIRSLVTSAAYQQSSSVTAKRSEEDPENVYLSRGPRFRVTAEQVRDMALASSGLLCNRLYGPPTRPPQPNMGLSAAFGSRTDWDTSKGEDRFRRGLYTQWRRSNPYPSMATFDAPSREVCVLKRDRTNTPLQALVTLNDPVFIEAAQGLARRVVIYELPTGSLEDRIERVFAHALSRKPTAAEVDAMVRLHRATRETLEREMERASKLATDPLGPLPAGADPVELATWTALNNVIMNLDEFLMTP